MLGSEYCQMSTLLSQAKPGFSVEGRKMEMGSFYSLHFFLYLSCCVLMVLDGRKKRAEGLGV